jgi:hypothetical protein
MQRIIIRTDGLGNIQQKNKKARVNNVPIATGQM